MSDARKECPTILRMMLRYDPETGRVFWRNRSLFLCKNLQAQSRINSSVAGKETFLCADGHGYRNGKVRGQNYKGHHVVWCLYHGVWPDQVLDHINGNRRDNRIANLRLVSTAENNLNSGLLKSNTSGVTGVSWAKRQSKWQAYIKKDRKRHHLGFFGRKADAIEARRLAEKRFGFFENSRRSVG